MDLRVSIDNVLIYLRDDFVFGVNAMIIPPYTTVCTVQKTEPSLNCVKTT